MLFSGHEASLSKVVDDMPTEDDQGRKGLTQYYNVEEPSQTEVPDVEQVDLAGKVSQCDFF